MKERCHPWVLLCFLALLLLSAGCQPQVVEVERIVEVEKAVERPAAPAPAAESSEQPERADQSVSVAEQLAVRQSSGAYSLTGRKIIKSGYMRMVVEDTERSMEDAIAIALNGGGYVISSETKLVDGLREADVKFGVPVEQFEAVQSKMRRLAVRVTDDESSGEDVTDQYVDLQSQLTNLEATASRVRDFLEQATTVEEALKVNQQLSELEGEIAQVKGRMNYLKDRAAFSTLTVALRPERPTPTPSPSPTPTPTPTPPGWHPEETFRSASRTLGTLFKVLGNMIIWIVVVVLPIVAPIALLIWLLSRYTKRRKRNRPRTPRAEPPTAPQEPDRPQRQDGPDEA